MNVNDFLKDNLSINIDAPEWKSTLMQMRVAINFDPDTLECLGAFYCKFALSDLLDEKIFSDREGYIVITNKGGLILAPSREELPLVATMTKKDIRSIEAKNKFTKTIVTVRTIDHIYDIKVAKKDGAELEKMLNKVRHMD